MSNKPPFIKVLVANRGEIAIRIMSTLKNMGIKSVAIYSDTDTNAMHVQSADEAYYVGNSPATESYLSIKNVMHAVRVSGADAVHPGYGFLSENSAFALALKREGVVLIGPSSNAIKKMGDKIEAKKIAIDAGVNTVPGYIGTIDTTSSAIEIAKNIGFPVMVKAAAGGGGRGMRVVYDKDEMAEAFESAKSEALNSFSDSRVFIEKFITNPRHIEIQVIADHKGNVVCLGERECSIQRRHQKVIEEAPSICIDEEIRRRMYSQVVNLCHKVGYYSAGTVEFIFDQNKNFYFLEMNTRLQVEHPVTELITGIDIVESMITVAGGQELAYSQDDIQLKGWAIECRVYAEDPQKGFLPSSGRITEYQEPPKNSRIRIDTSVDAGYEVSMFYDPMISKLCTYGNTRIEALNLMRSALSTYVISGISHNISFLEALISHPRLISGDINTNFIANQYPEGFIGAEHTSNITNNFIAATVYIFMAEQIRASKIDEKIKGKGYKVGTRWVVKIENEFYPFVVQHVDGGYNIRQINNKITVRAKWNFENKLFHGIVNGEKVYVKVERLGTGYKMTHAGVTINSFVRSPRIAELESMLPKLDYNLEASNELRANLSGQIISVKVREGDIVKQNQEILVLSAMKLENTLLAEKTVKIAKIYVSDGDHVSTDQLLVEFEEING